MRSRTCPSSKSSTSTRLFRQLEIHREAISIFLNFWFLLASTSSAFPFLLQSSIRMSTRSSDSKIAVIGASGRLGREAVYQLSAKGIPSRCLIRSNVPPDFLASLPNVEFVQGWNLYV
jgi:hypothetical protein